MKSASAKELAIKWLAASDKTEAELRLRLEKKGFPESEISEALQDLANRRWLDDQRVLEREAEIAARQPGIGREMAKVRLLRRGLNEDIVEERLNEWIEEGESAKALALLDAKLKPADPPARAARMLASRGFSEEAIRAALEHRFPDWTS